MAGYLIKDTTKEEREQIVAESLGSVSYTHLTLPTTERV